MNSKKENGENFIQFVVQGGVEATSKRKGRIYLTAKTTNLCTFNEITCKSLIGTQLPGHVRKVEVELTNTLIVQQERLCYR
jgi:hypothetical protein